METFAVPLTEKCPICGDTGKIVEQRDDQASGIRTKILRCQYCRHDFDTKQSKVEEYRPVVKRDN